VAWQVPGCGRQGEREEGRSAGRQEQRVNGGGHRARSLPFITEPTSHTTSSPQIRDVLFFSLPSTLFSYAPRQIDRTHAHASRRACAHIHHHTGPGIWICIWDPDLTLCCTYPASPLPTHIFVQEVVSSLPRRSTTITTTLPTTSSLACLVRQAARDKDTQEENRSAQTDNKTVASCVNFQPSETSRHIYLSTVFHSSPSINQLAT
jgi:hypothetical protein